MIVYENEEVIKYLKKRNISKLYLRTKHKIEQGDYKSVDLKKRRPFSDSVWYFRLNQKYRALATKENGNLYVFKISDHQ